MPPETARPPPPAQQSSDGRDTPAEFWLSSLSFSNQFSPNIFSCEMVIMMDFFDGKDLILFYFLLTQMEELISHIFMAHSLIALFKTIFVVMCFQIVSVIGLMNCESLSHQIVHCIFLSKQTFFRYFSVQTRKMEFIAV